MSILAVLLVLAAVLVVVPLALRLLLSTAGMRRAKRLPLGVRLACAGAGVAILAAVGIGTAHTVRAGYGGVREPCGLTVHVPTKPLGELPDTDYDMEWMEAQYLVHFIIVEISPTGTRPLAVQEVRINWPEDKVKTHEIALSAGGLKAEGTLNALSVKRPLRGDESGAPRLWGNMSLRTVWKNRQGSRGSAGTMGPAEKLVTRTGRLRKTFSTAQTTPTATCLLSFVTPASADDPLAVVPVEELLRQRDFFMRPAWQAALSSALWDQFHATWWDWPGVRLPYHLGLTTTLVLIAALGLLSVACLPRPVLVVGVLLGIVLYVAALDRAVQGAHLARLDDTEGALDDRLTACTMLADTFFYRDTAIERIEALLQDESAPFELRSLAYEINSVLHEKRIERETVAARGEVVGQCRVEDVLAVVGGDVVLPLEQHAEHEVAEQEGGDHEDGAGPEAQ